MTQKSPADSIFRNPDSRSGTHNLYKEFRELTRAAAVKSMYQDMAARHRARFASIHVRVCFYRPGKVAYRSPLYFICRFSRLLKFKRPRISDDHTSSNSLHQSCVSHCLTDALNLWVSLLPTDHPPSTDLHIQVGCYGCPMFLWEERWMRIGKMLMLKVGSGDV